MATQADVRRIARSLPGTIEENDRFAFCVRNKGKDKGYAWVWRERIHPKKVRVPNPKVLAVRVADLDEKDILLGVDEDKFFTEPHYNGYPVILVRLAASVSRSCGCCSPARGGVRLRVSSSRRSKQGLRPVAGSPSDHGCPSGSS
jgi:hypothetical protein